MKQLIIALLLVCLIGCAGHKFPVPSDFGLPELHKSNHELLLQGGMSWWLKH